MNSKGLPIREKIILAAIDCIENDGFQSITVRSIAREAGVNIAAINYYFGTKENLVDQVLKSTMDHFFSDWDQMLKAKDKTLRVRLAELFTYTIEGALRYPGITRAHLYDSLLLGKHENLFVRKFKSFLEDLLKAMKKEITGVTDRQLKLTAIQLMSSVMFAGLVPQLFHDFYGSSFADGKTRKAYVDHLIEHYLDQL